MMKIFRQKYMYNPEKPVYSSETAKTYNCMNTETKNKNLLIIEHLAPPIFVEPSQGVLQPIEIPTTAQPFSVYPITRCVSEVKRLSEPDAMYIIKCITESKLKKPAYIVMCDQGICCSDVEGLLPEKSPDLMQLTKNLLGLDDNFEPKESSIISKDGLSICKMIKNGENLAGSFTVYGWKDPRKPTDIVTDPEFIIFKARRKEEGPFNEEYGLAFHASHGICRFKYISLIKDGYQEHFYNEFTEVLNYIQKTEKPEPFLKNLKFSKDSKGIKIFTEIANQGSLSQFINSRSQMGQPLTQKNAITFLNNFVEGMDKFTSQFKNQGLGTLHIKCLYVNNNRICIGEPLLITDNIEKKLLELKRTFDYFAPEFKESIILYENLRQQVKQKMDTWSFGIILHKVLTKEMPTLDSAKKPLINKTKISPAMNALIAKCLDEYPISRPAWKDIKLKEIEKKSITIQEVKEEQQKRQEIRLGSRAEKRSEKPKSPGKKQRIIQELEEQDENKKQKESEEDKLKQKEEEIDQKMPVPQEISSKLKKVKLVIKTLIIMPIYIFVFFRTFLWSSVAIVQVRSNYASTSLHLVDNQGNRISTSTILTSSTNFFMSNDISFDDVQNKYQCIDESFNPIYNPEYSLLTYIQSPSFLALLLTGWLTLILICVTKAVSMWKGGISNRPEKNQVRHWLTYAFHELTLASLLFAHFYIYEFFYFAAATPCLSITNFEGLQPFFDSSLYLFLSNTQAYFQQVFSSLGILSIILLLSSCFYAWGPKIDQKYISSVPSILFRVIPFVLLLLICRIGVFMLFAPTAINDTTKMLPKIVEGSFQGFIGIIPEVFVACCVAIEVIIELFMAWCERKTAESDRLARFFNLRKKKTIDNEGSRVENSVMDNSKMKLESSEINDNY